MFDVAAMPDRPAPETHVPETDIRDGMLKVAMETFSCRGQQKLEEAPSITNLCNLWEESPLFFACIAHDSGREPHSDAPLSHSSHYVGV
jgi:hypothetical protein